MAELIVFEGIGGSGKTTLIERLNERLALNYFHEDRTSPPAETEDVDLFYLNRNIALTKALRRKRTKSILDRGYLSCLAVLYAKETIGIKNKLSLDEATQNCLSYPYDHLIVCYTTPFSISIQRRNERDGESHPIWGNADLMKYANKYLIENGSRFSRKMQLIDTTLPLSDNKIDEIAGLLQ